MNCKVCGNAVNDYELICGVCGNNLEAQRRREGAPGSRTESRIPYDAPARPTQNPSFTQEKDEAINRILYEGDNSSAKDRLEERRKKRQAERAASHTGISSLFTQERKEKPQAPAEPPPRERPYEQNIQPAAVEPEEKPRRKFSDDFHFSQEPKPEPKREETTYSAPVIPDQQTLDLPPSSVPERKPSTFTFFDPTPPEYRTREHTPTRPQEYAPPPPAQQEYAPPRQQEYAPPRQQEYAPPREPAYTIPQTPVRPAEQPPIDQYFALTQSEEEQARFEVDKKNEQFQELLDKEFERLKKREDAEPAGRTEPAAAKPVQQIPDDSGSYIQDRIDSYLKQSDFNLSVAMKNREESVRARGADPSAGRQAYEHPFQQGEVPVSDFDINKTAYQWQEKQSDPIQELLHAGRPDQEFERPYAESKPDLTYADLEIFDFEPVRPAAPAAERPAPAEMPAFAIPVPPPAAPAEMPAFAQPPAPAEPAAETPATPWGPSRNDAPTKESIAAFLDRPVVFPFDKKPVQAEPAVEESAEPIFDFEPIEQVVAPEAPVPEDEKPLWIAPEDIASEKEKPETEAIEQTEEQESAAPFTFDDLLNVPTAEEARKAQEEADAKEPSDWFIIKPPEEPTPGEEPSAGKEPETDGPMAPFVVLPEVPAVTAEERVPEKEPETDGPMAPFVVVPDSVSVQTPEPKEEKAEDKAPEEKAREAEAEEKADEDKAEKPGFVELITGEVPETEEKKDPDDEEGDDEDDDKDGPPRFYKEYTQGLPILTPEEIKKAEAEKKKAEEEAEEQKEELPGFLGKYDNEELGKKEEKGKKGSKSKKDSKDKEKLEEKKTKSQKRKEESKRSALSALITVLIIILVIVVACIIVLRLMPDSLGAYYIQDFIDTVQAKLGFGQTTDGL